MTLKEKLTQDLRTAMKSGDAVLLSTLRLVSAAIHNKEIEKRIADLGDDEVLAVLATEARKRKEAMIEYEKGGRAEAAKKESEELTILQRYLPAQASEEDMRSAVSAAVKSTGASGPKDMGKVMGAAMKTLKGRADGTMVQKIVQELLAEKNT